MNLEILPKLVTDIYNLFDNLNLSVTSLLVIGGVLTLLFLFAAREAAAWFFKIDDVKKDVRKLRQLVIDLEGEVRSLQGLLKQNISAKAYESASAEAAAAPAAIAAATAPTATAPAPAKSASANFPINH